MPKSQLTVIDDLQNNPDYIILNNPLSALKFVRNLGKDKEQILTEVYMPKLFYEIVSRLKPEHLEGVSKIENIKLIISIKDFLKSVETGHSKNLYNHIIDCVDRLQTTQIKWTENAVEKAATIISYYQHHPKSGEIEVQIHSELAKKVLELTYNNHFSFLKNYLQKLNNAQAIKLFPYFMSWRNKGMVEMTLDAFKKRFSCETEGYSKFSNLKLRVIDPAITEINDKTDLHISYNLLGMNLTGIRPRVTGLQFFIKEKAKQQQLPQPTDAKPIAHEEIKTVMPTVTVVNSTSQEQEELPSSVSQSEYFVEILRIFLVFEPQSTPENVKGFLSAFEHPKAVVEACLYAEQEQAKGNPIKNFRGYLVSGIPKGLGAGMLEQKTKEQVQKQKIEQRKKAEAEKVIQLENLLQQANDIRIAYQKGINQVIRNTATEADKDKVADILRGQNSIYAKRTLDDFRKPMLAGIFIGKFIETYPERFEDVQSTHKPPFQAIMSDVKKLDPTKWKELFY